MCAIAPPIPIPDSDLFVDPGPQDGSGEDGGDGRVRPICR